MIVEDPEPDQEAIAGERDWNAAQCVPGDRHDVFCAEALEVAERLEALDEASDDGNRRGSGEAAFRVHQRRLAQWPPAN
ncbi:hypothetical protein [Mesorhizobium sp. BHbdii]